MKTKSKISIPLENDVVRNQILQTLQEFEVLQLNVLKSKKTKTVEVLFLMKEKAAAETLRNRNWINRAAEIHNVIIHISSYDSAKYQLKLGNPFF